MSGTILSLVAPDEVISDHRQGSFLFQISAIQTTLVRSDLLTGGEQWRRRLFDRGCVHSHWVQFFFSSQSPFVVVVVATTATILYLPSSKERKYSTSITRVHIRARIYPSIHTYVHRRKKEETASGSFFSFFSCLFFIKYLIVVGATLLVRDRLLCLHSHQLYLDDHHR